MKSPPTKACVLRSENATWSGYVFTFTQKSSPTNLHYRQNGLRWRVTTASRATARCAYSTRATRTTVGTPGSAPVRRGGRLTHTHVYLAARRRLPRVHVRRGGLIIHSPWLRRVRRKRHCRRLHPHAQVLTHHMLTNDAVSARLFKVYTNATLSHVLWEQSYVIRAAGAATPHRPRRLCLHRHRPQARHRVRVKGGSG